MKENKKVVRFLLSAVGLWLGWFCLYDIWLSQFDNWLSLKVADGSALLLGLIGYAAETKNSVVLIDGTELVYIGDSCNGMVLMALFAGFIVAFPGPPSKKLVYIIFGILFVNLLNIIRVTTLALNSLYSSHTLEFNHRYTYTIVVYSFIFIMWMIWVKWFSSIDNYVSNTSSAKQ
ncbi:exosortase X [Pontibacter korlensis]|uniref:exosortase X n=1 Tax=Pontibacter korlensis TaxID=400092 RepID=UPI00061B3977|nr:archaeosortase/exosortase family protein [Pontibacter korlensis]